ncbi:MAG: hypothetical protein Q4C54_02430 [Clostridia bacterium]|nr:hypothetical protein [Clostridia bacterium]
MVSFALFAVHLLMDGGADCPVSAESIGPDSFTFRTPLSMAQAICPDAIRLVCRGLQAKGEAFLRRFALTREDEDSIAVFHVTTDEEDAVQLLRRLMQDLTRYQHLKNDCGDAALSHALTGYPAEKELQFASSFHAWRRGKLSALAVDDAWADAMNVVPHLAVMLHDGPQTEDFLHISFLALWKRMLDEAGLSSHPLAERTPDTVLMGSLTCPRLLPDPSLLMRLLDRCRAQSVTPALCLPPMAEDDTAAFRTLLETAAHAWPGLEVVTGDLGLPVMAAALPLRFTAGPLLNRRRKDTRLDWWQGDPAMLRETSANSDAMAMLYSRLNITGRMWDVCGYPFTPCAGDSLMLPFSLLSTGQPCTLSAIMQTGDRGRQCHHAPCGKLCRDAALMYGEHLNMVGIGNSVYGLDSRSLTDGAYLKEITSGVKRLVVSLPDS